MPSSVLDVISSALRLIGVLSSNEVPAASEARDSLKVYQDMVDSWNAQRLMVFNIPRILFSLVPLQQTYTMGPGGDFDVPRPAKINGFGIISLNNPTQPLEIPMDMMTLEDWESLPVKNIQGTLPLRIYDDQGYPLRNLSFWTVPTQVVQVAIYPWAALNSPATLTTGVSFPPGYAQAFRYNLAVLLAAEFPVVPPQVLGPVAQIAKDSMAVVKSMNIPVIDLRCDPAVQAGSGYYDWRSDTPISGRQGY